MLIEKPFVLNDLALPQLEAQFIEEGKKRAKRIDCFDFVPSDYEHIWSVLNSFPNCRFCELGSGIGVVTGLAHRLGFEAVGIEINAELAAASRALFTEFSIDAQIHTGDYLDHSVDADLYFVYCWPGQMNRVEKHFSETTPSDAKLLICHGASDVHLKSRCG